MLLRNSESSKTSEGERYVVLSPPEYQVRHKYIDSLEKILRHFPHEENKLIMCSCEENFLDEYSWAEHLTGLLFKKP